MNRARRKLQMIECSDLHRGSYYLCLYDKIFNWSLPGLDGANPPKVRASLYSVRLVLTWRNINWSLRMQIPIGTQHEHLPYLSIVIYMLYPEASNTRADVSNMEISYDGILVTLWSSIGVGTSDTLGAPRTRIFSINDVYKLPVKFYAIFRGSSGGVPKYSVQTAAVVTQIGIYSRNRMPITAKMACRLIALRCHHSRRNLFDVTRAWYPGWKHSFTGQCTTITHGHLHRFVVQIVAGLIDRDAHQGKRQYLKPVNPGSILWLSSGVTPNPIIPAISMTALATPLWWQWRQRIR